jgi:hypothetical protein
VTAAISCIAPDPLAEAVLTELVVALRSVWW